ncbi:ABC1 family-domain-containing protein [Powellomyces hirtus]|nr:ABC1 family-domain-containing protein [Powellomyces hirtus]
MRFATTGPKRPHFGGSNREQHRGGGHRWFHGWWSGFGKAPPRHSYWKSAPGWILLGSAPALHVPSPLSSTVPLASAPPKPNPQPVISTVVLMSSTRQTNGVFTVIINFASSVLRAIRVSFRFLQLAVLFGPVILAFPIWFLLERKSFKSNQTPRLWWVEYLVWSFEVSGPTFTKLGQWASSRTDLFPPYVCSILAKLQSHVSPHSLAATRRIIKKEYGVDIEDMFEEFGETPIGVGAIAQVYKAKLRPSAPILSHASTLQCAVKVLHPGVESLINADLTIMNAVASLIHFLPDAEWLSFPDEVAMFGHMMREQLDLRCEAQNLDRFSENFKDRHNVGFPTPFMPLARKTVLIEEYQNAIPIRKFLDHGDTPFDRELGKIGLDSFLRMLVMDNFVHADLHPGNIFVSFRRSTAQRPWSKLVKSSSMEQGEDLDPAELARLAALPPAEWHDAMIKLREQGYAPRLIFLDAGLVSTLSDENLRNFLDLFRAVAEFDGRRVAKLMMERSRTPHTVIDKEGFVATMHDFLEEVKHNTLKLGSIKVGDILAKVFNMVRTHHIKIEGDFANVGISIVLLEGIGRRLDPDIDLLQEALPVLRQAARQGRGGAYGELGGGTFYWLIYAYQKTRPILLLADRVDIHLYEKAIVFFPE